VTSSEQERVVITGIGMVTPLGNSVDEVLRRMRAGESAAGEPGFDASAFECPVCAQVRDFDAKFYVTEAKMARLMNRDAQFAVAAARLALRDARVSVGTTFAPEEVGLFGATGLAGLPLRDVAPLLSVSEGAGGGFDLTRFGQAGLKAVSPILSFKILSNMPLCFVSINENIQGPNAIYTPWEGEGAQAIEAGMRALRNGDARCALVGGCDVKTHELAFATLQQQGLFGAGPNSSKGIIPGEGAVFLVLETERMALARRARVYGCLSDLCIRPHGDGEEVFKARLEVLRALKLREAEVIIGGDETETELLKAAEISAGTRIYPKMQAGDLFAGAALLQVALGAAVVGEGAKTVLANCFGHGSNQAAFVLQAL
jgi:3-oxoacyl-(acyl-carrier-protein) synthase